MLPRRGVHDALVTIAHWGARPAGRVHGDDARGRPCGVRSAAAVSTGRVELPDVPAGAVPVTAYVVEGLGTLRHASFNVSLEQDAADS